MFATGYSPRCRADEEDSRRAYPDIMQKPYTPRDLARYIRAALDQQNLNVKYNYGVDAPVMVDLPR